MAAHIKHPTWYKGGLGPNTHLQPSGQNTAGEARSFSEWKWCNWITVGFPLCQLLVLAPQLKPVTMQADQKQQNMLFKSQNQGLEGYLHKTNRPQQKKKY